jgi:drug/metabolite transporter (DMT)-like permease
MQALLGAVISSLGFGSANVLIKKTLENVSIPVTLFMTFASGATSLFIYALITGTLAVSLPANPLLPVVMALGEIALYLLLYKTFSSSNVTVASALLGLYSILTALFSLLFLGGLITARGWLFIAIMVGGALLVSIDWPGVFRNGFDKRDLTKGLGWIMITTLAHAIYFPSLAAYTADGDLINKLLLVKLIAAVIFLVCATLVLRKAPLPTTAKVLPLSLLGVLEAIGWVGFAWATTGNLENVGIVTAALNMAVLVTAVLAYFFLKEKLKPLQYFGIFLIVAALIWQSV